MTSELIEQVARAICVSDGAPIPEIRSWHKRYAQAAIAAMQADTSEQVAELAKFKALAETLAGAGAAIIKLIGPKDCRLYASDPEVVTMVNILLQYKEATQ